MKIKLLAVDIDETSVNSRHRMTNRTKEALEEVIRKGIFVVPVTGRCLEGLPAKFRELDISYFITSNGAKVYDWLNQEVLYRRLIPNQVACEVLQICQESNLGLAVHTEGKCYDNTRLQQIYRQLAYFGDFKFHRRISDLHSWAQELRKPLEKIQVFSFHQEELEELKRKFANFPMLELALSTSGYIEITHREAKKGIALEQLCKHLEIPMEDVMAIGDNVNDASMLSKVGLPVAMGNAKEEIQQMAKYVTASNDEDGVAQAVRKWVLGES